MNKSPEQTTRGGYPKDAGNPDEWKAFLARYLDNRVTNGVHDGIGLVALHIVDAIREARLPAVDLTRGFTPEDIADMEATNDG